jgi:acyl dehydratase
MLKPGLYTYDQVQIGDSLLTDWAKVTPEAIDTFAALTQDRFAIHLSDEGARAHGFDRRVAHGLLILSLVEGLKSTAPAQLDTFASLGWDWSFRAPVFAGDSIRASVTVAAKRAAGAGKGMLTLSISVENQAREVVQQAQTRLMAQRTKAT